MDPHRRYWFPTIGYNYRMTNLQAAIALAQLERIEWHQEKRWQIAAWYNAHLKNVTQYLELPIEKPWARHAFWMYSILLRNGGEEERDELMRRLGEDGVETRPLFYPLHIMPPYEELHKQTAAAANTGSSIGTLANATCIAARGLNLPTHGNLQESDVEYVANCVKEHIKSLSP